MTQMEDSQMIDSKNEESEDIQQSKDPDSGGTWRSCCFTLSKGAVKYMAAYSISVLVLFFSFYMLSSNPDSPNTALWSSMISGIASQYLPSPVYNAKEK